MQRNKQDDDDVIYDAFEEGGEISRKGIDASSLDICEMEKIFDLFYQQTATEDDISKLCSVTKNKDISS